MKGILVEGKIDHKKAGNRSNHFIALPLEQHFAMNLVSVSIVQSLLKGTESNEWLLLAENKVYEQIKKGTP